jgi:type II secretion system protein I
VGDRKGFTLIEVLVSMSILAATLLLAYQVISGAIEAADRSERWTAAAYLAEGMVLAAGEEFPETAETHGKFQPPNEAYSWKRVVRASLHSDAVEVEVTVSWTSGRQEGQLSVTGLAVKK